MVPPIQSDKAAGAKRHHHANGIDTGHAPASADASAVDYGDDQLLPPQVKDVVPPDWTDWMRLRAFLWLSILRLVD
ncbi:hypothetical protein HK405_013564, partial [Cladochytrium tenue]